MLWIKIVISIFIILETGNIAMLYFYPDSKMANSVGVFKAWEKTKQDPEIHNFTKYLVNWVAGTKIILILLLALLIFTADQKTLVLAGGIMIISISTFYWRLFPLIRRMDHDLQIDPRGYSAVLGWMIMGFILFFLAAMILTVI